MNPNPSPNKGIDPDLVLRMAACHALRFADPDDKVEAETAVQRAMARFYPLLNEQTHDHSEIVQQLWELMRQTQTHANAVGEWLVTYYHWYQNARAKQQLLHYMSYAQNGERVAATDEHALRIFPSLAPEVWPADMSPPEFSDDESGDGESARELGHPFARTQRPLSFQQFPLIPAAGIISIHALQRAFARQSKNFSALDARWLRTPSMQPMDETFQLDDQPAADVPGREQCSPFLLRVVFHHLQLREQFERLDILDTNDLQFAARTMDDADDLGVEQAIARTVPWLTGLKAWLCEDMGMSDKMLTTLTQTSVRALLEAQHTARTEKGAPRAAAAELQVWSLVGNRRVQSARAFEALLEITQLPRRLRLSLLDRPTHMPASVHVLSHKTGLTELQRAALQQAADPSRNAMILRKPMGDYPPMELVAMLKLAAVVARRAYRLRHQEFLEEVQAQRAERASTTLAGASDNPGRLDIEVEYGHHGGDKHPRAFIDALTEKASSYHNNPAGFYKHVVTDFLWAMMSGGNWGKNSFKPEVVKAIIMLLRLDKPSSAENAPLLSRETISGLLKPRKFRPPSALRAALDKAVYDFMTNAALAAQHDEHQRSRRALRSLSRADDGMDAPGSAPMTRRTRRHKVSTSDEFGAGASASLTDVFEESHAALQPVVESTAADKRRRRHTHPTTSPMSGSPSEIVLAAGFAANCYSAIAAGADTSPVPERLESHDAPVDHEHLVASLEQLIAKGGISAERLRGSQTEPQDTLDSDEVRTSMRQSAPTVLGHSSPPSAAFASGV